MSQQEAASIGPFEPMPSQQQTSVASDSDRGSPFSRASEPEGPALPDYQAAEAAAEARSRRRRAWTIIALALIIPAAAAAALALILTGGENTGPTDTVTRVTATPESSTATLATTSPVTTAAPASTTTAATTTTQQSTVAAQPASANAEASETAAAGGTTEAAESATATAEATATLSPEARLAAWPEIERIEVVAGETLWLLAYQYDTTVSAIALLNGITDPESLSVGQVLSIPVGFGEEVSLTGEPVAPAVSTTESAGSDSGTATSFTTAVTLTPAAGTPPDLASWANTVQMVIVAGDSLDAIANANGTTVEAIQVLNGIADPNRIFEGQEILVPVGYGITLDVPSTTVETVDTSVVNTDTTTADTPAAEDDMLETATGTGEAADADMLETEGGSGAEEDMLETE
jgi:LysM repeat protein